MYRRAIGARGRLNDFEHKAFCEAILTGCSTDRIAWGGCARGYPLRQEYIMRSEKIASRLAWALEFGQLVRIVRPKPMERLEGYVVALSDEWALVHRFYDSFDLDGYVAIRLRDIRRVMDAP